MGSYSDLYKDDKLIYFNTWVHKGACPNDFLNWMGLVNSVPLYIRNMAKNVKSKYKPYYTTSILNKNK